MNGIFARDNRLNVFQRKDNIRNGICIPTIPFRSKGIKGGVGGKKARCGNSHLSGRQTFA